MTELCAALPLLSNFFSAYLHEDMDFLYGTPEAAFELFISSESSDGLRRVESELRQLASYDGDLNEALYRMGSNVTPEADYGRDNAEWLIQLADRTAEVRRHGSAGDAG